MGMIAFNDKFELASDVNCSDKSLTHRAFILAAIADGTSVLNNVTFSRDVCSTVNALRALGANISVEKDRAVVAPIRALPNEVTIECGNSGTTARLLAGLVAGLGVKARFVGDESLSNRPMKRVVEPLRRLGANIDFAPDCLFVCQGGELRGATIRAEVNSAQVKSAVLLAGLFAEGRTEYIESTLTRDHTERMLAQLGADIETSFAEGSYSVCVGASRPRAFSVELPNDPSAVAYSAALALLTGREATFTNVLLNPARLGFYNVLKRSGAKISFCNVRDVLGEQIGDVRVKRSALSPFVAAERDVSDGIDEVPLLASMALFVKGEHRFQGVAELAHKECDRIEAIKHIANVVGKRCCCDGNDMTIVSDGKIPRGKRFKTFGDHRIAMCGTVVSVAIGCGCVDDAPFDVSDPAFLERLGIYPLKLGLIGAHAEQSVSPRLQTYLSMRAGVCCSYDAVTLPDDISDTDLLRVIDKYDGLNVTMPFKTRAAKLLNAPVPSVNTIGKRIAPCSTDGYGLVHSLQKHEIDFAGKPLWIVGAGGAAEACVRELLRFGCKLHILDRTAANAERLRCKYSLPSEISRPFGVLTFIPECPFEQSVPLPESCEFVFIADYMGRSTLREKANARGLTVVDGLEMNYAQGAASFSLWTGTPVQDDYADYIDYVKEFHYI